MIARPCPEPRCPKLTNGGRCTSHKRALRRRQDATRGTPIQRGYGPGHQTRRAAVLTREPWCRRCAAQGRRTLAMVADHIVPLRQGGTSALANYQALCRRCHNGKTNREKE